MSDDRQSQIEALFRSYRESLPALMVELDSMWAELSKCWNADLAAEFDRKVHGLAGSASTFELLKIGDMAKELEHQFKPLLDVNTDAARMRESAQLLLKLKTAIEQNTD